MEFVSFVRTLHRLIFILIFFHKFKIFKMNFVEKTNNVILMSVLQLNKNK